jgi:thiol-disulfide isomerase/thioredoxin
MSVTDLPPRTLRTRILALAGVTVIVGGAMGALWAMGVFDTAEGAPAELVQTPPVDGVSEIGPIAGQIAPDFEISDFGGDRFRLSDYRGKVVYLNFWATWCVPCEAELPEIYRLHQEQGDELVVITINKGESVDRAKDFFDRLGRLDGGKGVNFTVDGLDPTSVVADRYARLGSLPFSVFIDQRGVISRVNLGQMRYEEMKAAVEEAIDR